MPGFTTHYIGGTLNLSQLQRCTLKDSISSHIYEYQLGLQGPDIFLYNLLDLLSKSHPCLGTIMHTKHTGLFIQNCLDKIISSPKEHQGILSAYLSGFLCHYCLDTQCHPYIYSKSDYSLTTFKSTKSLMNPVYYSKHLSLESLIDSLICEHYLKDMPDDYHKAHKSEVHPESIIIISDLLSICINQTYSITASPKLIRQTIQLFSFENKCLSSLKNKRNWIQRMEYRYLGYPLLSSMIPSNHLEDSLDALNIHSSTWYSPWTPHEANTDTFITLFQSGIKRCTNILDALNSYLHTTENNTTPSRNQCTPYQQFIDIVGNLSYHSGLLLS